MPPRPRRLLLVPLLAAALAAPTGAAAATPCDGADEVPQAGDGTVPALGVLCLVNRARGDRGLGRLRPEARLGHAARVYSRAMVVRRFFAHDGPLGDPVSRLRRSGYIRAGQGWAIGENIAWGSGRLASPQSVVRSWLRSPGHRANILATGFREIGIGVALGTPFGRSGATYTQEFGARSGHSASRARKRRRGAHRRGARPRRGRGVRGARADGGRMR